MSEKVILRNPKEQSITFEEGRDFVIKPFLLSSDRPGPKIPVRNYECAYCQVSYINRSLMEAHLADGPHDKPYPFTGVHADLVDVHRELYDTHRSKVAAMDIASPGGDVEPYEGGGK